MCGIVGILGTQEKNLGNLLVAGLKRLEYRGYDSAGIAVLSQNAFKRHRAFGKLSNLKTLQTQEPLTGSAGIGHTRWATHGVPNENNAHPHMTARVALVHNGIIENHASLKHKLEKSGVQFVTQTDTEVILHLLDQALQEGFAPQEAVEKTLKELQGAYAVAILFREAPHLMIGARHGPPLAVGHGVGEMYLGSDGTAFAHLTHRLSYLEEGDMAVLTPDEARIFSLKEGFFAPVQRAIHHTKSTHLIPDKGAFPHFMAKEIHEQPEVIRQTLSTYFTPDKSGFHNLVSCGFWKEIPRLTIVACGTSYYAGLVAKYWFESLARLPVDVDIASEFRYRHPPMPSGGVSLFISQSGETADTLAAQAYVQSQQQTCLALVNVPESSLARAADAVLMTVAGIEVGVASTKAFTTQLTVLALLAITAAQERGHLSDQEYQDFCKAFAQLPTLIDEVLLCEPKCKDLAYHLAKAKDVLYLGRGRCYPIALEGALKLKEISYIHAEGYPAGELKHGPIALIDDTIPVIGLAPYDEVFEKTASNIQEVLARKGQIILISDAEGHRRLSGSPDPERDVCRLYLPSTAFCPMLSPILYSIPVQLLAYHTAFLKGTDVDQPRNLAKSVTVE